MSEILLSRAWQERIFSFLILLSIFFVILGIYTLRISPTLSFDPDFSLPEQRISKIAGINLNPFFFNQLPEFFDPDEETAWWRLQERVYNTLKGKNAVNIEFAGKDGITRDVEAGVGFMLFSEIIKENGAGIPCGSFIYHKCGFGFPETPFFPWLTSGLFSPFQCFLLHKFRPGGQQKINTYSYTF